MTKDLVSIITPTYNCAEYITEALLSVQAQTYQKWELIIVDDCSTDNTREILNPFMAKDPRIIYMCNEKNCGAAISRNRALQRARGRWIAFLDSDDLWQPTKLERQIQFMQEYDYHFSYHNYSEIDEESRETGVVVSGPKHIGHQGMLNFCWPGCLTVMYDADYIGLIQVADIKKNNDYAMWLKVSRKATCHLLNEPLAQYRRGRSESISTHSYATLVKWHYRLFREAEGMSCFNASAMTIRNLFFGAIKKLAYVHSI